MQRMNKQKFHTDKERRQNDSFYKTVAAEQFTIVRDKRDHNINVEEILRESFGKIEHFLLIIDHFHEIIGSNTNWLKYGELL